MENKKEKGMGITDTYLDVVLVPGYAVLDASAKILNSNARDNFIRLVQAQLECLTLVSNTAKFNLLLKTFKNFTSFAVVPHFTQRFMDIISGRALVLTSAVPEREAWHHRIFFDDESEGYPNIIRFASTVSCAIADAYGSCLFLRQMGLDVIAAVSQATATYPIFNAIRQYSVESIRNTCGIIGLLLSIIDCQRDLYVNVFTDYTAIKVAANICKIAYILLAASTYYEYMLLAQIAQSAASALYLTRYVMREYRIEE